MTAEFRPIQPEAPEILVVQAANLIGVVDIDAYLKDQDRLLEAVGAITSQGTPSGQAWVRRVAESDISHYPDKLSQMIDAVEAAKQRRIHHGHLPNQRSPLQHEVFERADRVDLRGYLRRFLGIDQRERTFDQAISVVEDDITKREDGTTVEARIRRVGSNFINLMKRNW